MTPRFRESVLLNQSQGYLTLVCRPEEGEGSYLVGARPTEPNLSSSIRYYRMMGWPIVDVWDGETLRATYRPGDPDPPHRAIGKNIPGRMDADAIHATMTTINYKRAYPDGSYGHNGYRRHWVSDGEKVEGTSTIPATLWRRDGQWVLSIGMGDDTMDPAAARAYLQASENEHTASLIGEHPPRRIKPAGEEWIVVRQCPDEWLASMRAEGWPVRRSGDGSFDRVMTQLSS